MRWEGRRQSENVEDRRGIGGPVLVGGGLITLLLMVAMMFLFWKLMHGLVALSGLTQDEIFPDPKAKQ